AHRMNAGFYRQNLPAGIRFAGDLPGGNGAWWLFTVLLRDAAERGRFVRHMTDAGITVSRVHARNDTHTCFASYRTRLLPGTDELRPRALGAQRTGPAAGRGRDDRVLRDQMRPWA